VQAPCTKEDITQARARILNNFQEVSNSKSEFFSTFHELEVHLAKFIGESSSKFIERVSGMAKEKDRLGLVIDLSLATFRENVRDMVIDAGRITRDTPRSEPLQGR
jgi:hypothetical protein